MTPLRGRTVYSTGPHRLCPACAEPLASCRCDLPRGPSPGAAQGLSPRAIAPAGIKARLRLETKGRSGKHVTVIDRLPRSGSFLAGLAADLKRALGTGGALREGPDAGAVELQGDCRARVRELLEVRGITVKG